MYIFCLHPHMFCNGEGTDCVMERELTNQGTIRNNPKDQSEINSGK